MGNEVTKKRINVYEINLLVLVKNAVKPAIDVRLMSDLLFVTLKKYSLQRLSIQCLFR